MRVLTNINKAETSNLQGKVNMMCHAISDRTVSLSGEAHSPDVVTITITCAGIRGTMSKTMVMSKISTPLIGKDGEFHTAWHAWINGYEYELASFAEFQSVVKRQVNLIKPLVQSR